MKTAHLDRRDLGIALLLLAVTLAFHWPLITPDVPERQSYPDGDFYGQFHAFATYEHDRLWAGEIPLWNPHNFGGHPFLADIQAAVFYPLSLLTILLSGPGPFSPLWLELEAIAHFYLAALFTYLFVRRVTRTRAGEPRRVAALVSALTFAYGGYLTSYPPLQLAILETQVWLPLILLLLDIGLAGRQRRALLGAGGLWGVALLAGHPQSAMYLTYAALAYGLFRSCQEKLHWRWALTAQLSWLGTGLGIAAVQILPSWEFMQLSVRARSSYGTLAAGFGLRDLAQVLLPGMFTHWSPIYVGVLPLFLAGVAFVGGHSFRPRQSREKAFWGILVVVSLLLSFGGKAFLYRLFYWAVPGFNLFRSQERAIYLTSFGLAVLAGYGWDRLCTFDKNVAAVRWARRGSLASGCIALITAGIAWRIGSLRSNPEWLGALARWLGWSWIVWALLRWMPARGSTRKRALWSALALLLVAADLGVTNMGANLSPGSAGFHVYDAGWLGPVFGDSGIYRIANEWGLPGNGGCWLDAHDLYGASPLRLQAHKEIADALPHWRLWQLFGVRYVATWEHDLPGPFPATRVAMRGEEWAKNTVYVHRIVPRFPRAWVVHRARQVDDEQALSLLADPEFDPFDELLVAGPVPEEWAFSSPGLPATVEITSYAPEQIALLADLSVPGWLVTGEWNYPGWQVWVDGLQRTIRRADYGLRAVPLDAGSHRVEFRYRPTSVRVGATISLLTLSLAVSLMLRKDNRQTAMRE